MQRNPNEPTQRKVRRGTSSNHAAFAGALGELTYDTTLNTLRVHNGVQTGGFILARLNPDGTFNIGNTHFSADGNTLTFGSDANVQIVNGELQCWDQAAGAFRPFGCLNGQPIFGDPVS